MFEVSHEYPRELSTRTFPRQVPRVKPSTVKLSAHKEMRLERSRTAGVGLVGSSWSRPSPIVHLNLRTPASESKSNTDLKSTSAD